MTDQESLLAAIHQGVELATYANAWPRMFEAERSRLVSLFPGVFAAIEHFGSTAIPQISAKQIVDILVGVESLFGAGALAANCVRRVTLTSIDVFERPLPPVAPQHREYPSPYAIAGTTRAVFDAGAVGVADWQRACATV